MLTYHLNENTLIEICNAVQNTKILFIGDLCLDLYFYADMKKSVLSRETPHYPLPVVKEDYSPGGGGNVVNNIAALQVKELTVVSIIGNDWRGFLLEKTLKDHHIDTRFIQRSEKYITNTYCKPLRMGISDVVYEDPRLDFENYDFPDSADEAAILSTLEAEAEAADVIIVADQMAHGVITPNVISLLSSLSEKKPVIIDSRSKISELCGKGFILKPNELEAANALGLSISPDSKTIENFASIAEKLQQKNERPVIVTVGELGAIWCDEKEAVHVPTYRAVPPIDIVGAGDTFFSAFSTVMAAGFSGPEAIAFANLASGVTVKKLHTTGTASLEEITNRFKEVTQ